MQSALILAQIALLILALTLFSILFKRMTRSLEDKAFLLNIGVAFFMTFCDLLMEYYSRNLNGLRIRLFAAYFYSYLYFIFRNFYNVAYLLFLMAMAGVRSDLRKRTVRMLVWGPYGLAAIMIFANLFTPYLFSISLEEGYRRGPGMLYLYALGFIYMLIGFYYLSRCVHYLDRSKWMALLAMYVITMLVAFIQYMREGLLIEMIAFSMVMLLDHLLIQRPEEILDFSVGLYSWNAYRNRLIVAAKSRTPVRVVIIRYLNASQARSVFGEQRYNQFVRMRGQELENMLYRAYGGHNIYYGAMGCICIVFDDAQTDANDLLRRIQRSFESESDDHSSVASVLQTRYTTIRFLQDIQEVESMINFTVNFPGYMSPTDRILDGITIQENTTLQIKNYSARIISRALREHYFEMYYQPIYNLHNGLFESAEALIRLKDPEFGFVSPAIFIPEAELHGYMAPIGDFVLNSVYEFLSQNSTDSLKLRYMEVNLSVEQCIQKNLVETILGLEKKYAVPPSKVNLEVTETMNALNPEAMIRNLQALHAKNYHFSLDDYGTGYSNILRVMHLPLSLVKIDKELVDMLGDAKCASVVANTITMMHQIGMKIVCEGVETAEQVEILREMGCDYIQGYYYAKPMPREQFLSFLKAHNLDGVPAGGQT